VKCQSNCINLELLDHSNNSLSGNISSHLGNLVNLLYLLDLSSNILTGKIPPTLGNLVMLQNLNLSHNNLIGQIPCSIGAMSSLSSIELSYNQLEGPIPDTKLFEKALIQWFVHNINICGTLQALPPCGVINIKKNDTKISRKIIIITILSFFGALITMLSLWGIYLKNSRTRRTTKPQSISKDLHRGDIFTVWNFDGRDVYDDIIKLTENFNEKYCIGIGGHARVYKVILRPENIIIAVKKIQLSCADNSIDTKAFQNEILTLTQIRHHNIVKLFGYCSLSQNKFLVYEHYERGYLKYILSNEEIAKELDWPKRKAIVKDVACALSYMHHDCFPPIVHRDVTSINILLDSQFKASLSDFGTSKFLKPESSNWSILAGTYGYMAPGSF
jgi:tRNA A-37 threonylcarbamoyl transferase component Bud32